MYHFLCSVSLGKHGSGDSKTVCTISIYVPVSKYGYEPVAHSNMVNPRLQISALQREKRKKENKDKKMWEISKNQKNCADRKKVNRTWKQE